MTCDDAEVRIAEGSSSPELAAHLAGCEACRLFARDLAVISTQPSLTAVEAKQLDSLEADTWRAWQHQQRVSARPSWLGYAAAASFGALVASAGFWSARPVKEVVVERLVEAPAPRSAAFDADEPNSGADEVFFEVTWPDFPEGETP
jgi:hypothetical protein